MIVNKRINQRFFATENGKIFNPVSGCVIDSQLVEEEDSNVKFDFYLIPQQTT